MNEIPKPAMLFDVSRLFLQDLVMASLDRSSRHLKAAKISWTEAVQEQAIAIAAQYFLENREEMQERARHTLDMQSLLEFPQARRSA